MLDGDSEQLSDVVLRKPGKYAVVCFLTDRDGKGKPHLAEGHAQGGRGQVGTRAVRQARTADNPRAGRRRRWRS